LYFSIILDPIPNPFVPVRDKRESLPLRENGSLAASPAYIIVAIPKGFDSLLS